MKTGKDHHHPSVDNPPPPVCRQPTPSEQDQDALNRLAFYTRLAKLAVQGDHQGIREACEKVPEALCTNRAMDLMGDANAIESLQRRRESDPSSPSSRPG